MQKIKLLFLVMLVGALAACSSKPISPTGYAIYDTLQADAQLRSWVEACKQLNPELNRASLLTQREWWSRNSIYVESADFGLAYDQLKISADRAETGARLALAATWGVVESADKTVEKALEKGDPVLTCHKVLQSYDKGELDLGSKSKHARELNSLRKLKALSEKDVQLEKASVAVRSGKEYGRSFYVVEKLINRQGCPNGDVRLLKNDWPNEVYDARCKDRSYILVQCEWGNCRVTE